MQPSKVIIEAVIGNSNIVNKIRYVKNTMELLLYRFCNA